MYLFYLPIGDVLADGHGLFEKFLVQSNFPVEKVREAHYRIPEATGINIEGICNAYQEDTVEPETAEKLRGMGLLDIVDGAPLPVDDMAELWLALLQLADPELQLEIVPDTIPMLSFSGRDEQGRYIGEVGYGLF